jgi:hypothetical protein
MEGSPHFLSRRNTMAVRMIATRDMTYATRRLKAGDEIADVSGPNARLLTALGRARQVDAAQEARDAAAEAQANAKALLRDEYERVLGKRPFNGWDADTLREKIAEASA